MSPEIHFVVNEAKQMQLSPKISLQFYCVAPALLHNVL